MNKQQAQQLIKSTFEATFDKGRFSRFASNLLNHIEDAPFTYQGKYIPEKFRQYIKTLERIGKYNDGEHTLDILVITLQKETSLERARNMQRNFIAWYLNGSRGGEMKDAALVAYVSPNHADWRFSLVKMDYKFEKTKTGKIKVKQEFTPARRWSFLVGANEKSHTAQSRLVKLLANDEHDPTLLELEEAFNIETVTKEFFLKYRELFLRTKEALDKVVKNDPRVNADFEGKDVDTVNFAKKLLGQIVFLYFLQKKGWFGVGRDDDWGTGSKQFLRELFEGRHGSYNNFFNDILEPLFYEALRIDRSHDDDYYSRFNCKIPFLNGGLFDPIGNYDWVHTDINLPDDLFSNMRETKEGDIGDGILDVFDRYNFTVQEDEPLEKEVAIDPELLGKAYEKFNAIRPDNFDEFVKALKSGQKGEENRFNKKFGVYYTPREIVHYMCKQSLINYLTTCAEEIKLETPISKQDIEDLIEVGEMITEHEATALIKGENIKNGIQKTSEYTALLSEGIRQNAKIIDDWLADITVCDPAVGSGAFPVGMMTEIVRARNVLSVFLNNQERNDYELKRRCIEHSLYGVDIDPGAVEIARLRLWLSLMVDEENFNNIKPLPNLDYKVVCGNSLVGFPENWNSPIEKKIIELQHKLIDETNPSKKEEFKSKIDGKLKKCYDMSEKVYGYKINFDFRLVFAEVFQRKDGKGGFDVVIANPPYLKERDNKSVFKAVTKGTWGKKWHQGKMDFWFFFLHKSIDIVKKKGIISFITSRYWLNSAGAKKLIHRVREELSFVSLVDIGKLKVFDEVAGQHMVALYVKDKEHDNFTYKKLKNDLSDIQKQSETENIMIKSLKNSKLYSNDNIKLDIDKLNYTDVVCLGNIFDVSQGLVQNPDKVSKKAAEKYNLPAGKGVFVLSENELKVLGLNTKEMQFVKPFFDEHDIYKYLVWARKKKYLLYITKENCSDISQYPNLKAHLEVYKRIMMDRRETKNGLNSWFHLHWPRERKYFENPKIILPAMFDDPSAGYQQGPGYFGLSSNVVVSKDKKYSLMFVLGILNSRFARYWFYKHGKKRGIGVDIGVSKLREFPVKKAQSKVQAPIISIVNKILPITKDEDYFQNPRKQAKLKELEREIDKLVYQLYGLTDDEIKIIEGKQ